MKVLIVSHNVFERTNNMGKTLMSYFPAFGVENVAQFYIHAEQPTDGSVCCNYYQFTDADAIKSIPVRSHTGRIFRKEDLKKQSSQVPNEQSALRTAYAVGKKRRPATMILREILWNLSGWNSKHLRQWLDEFSPDVIFYAAGDYAFTYRIAVKIADYVKKPLVLLCVDDFYCCNRNESSPIGRMAHRSFMKTVRRTMERTSLVFTICDKMGEVYGKMFGVLCRTLHTGAQMRDLQIDPKAKQISYIGNLGFDRYLQLIDMGKALHQLAIEGGPRWIDVYSAEQNEEYISALKAAPGIRFHGAISAEEVLEVMSNSMAVIHTESFDEAIQKLVRFSVSTKIAETLMYGPCLIAYGPEGIASLEYLKAYDAAYVMTSGEELQDGLREIVTNSGLREQILQNARALAYQNHRMDLNSDLVYRSVSELEI